MSKEVEEYEWFRNHQEEVRKYKGKHIAIVGNEIVAWGDSAKGVYEEAKRKYPNKNPLMHYVQTGEHLIL